MLVRSARDRHLTNHCIATEHAEYGKYEPTNEKFYPAFDAELAERYPDLAAKAADVRLFGGADDANGGAAAGDVGSVMETVVLPQIRRQVVQSLLAARERLESDGEYYRPFQVSSERARLARPRAMRTRALRRVERRAEAHFVLFCSSRRSAWRVCVGCVCSWAALRLRFPPRRRAAHLAV
jgi:hypothetical protein